MDVNGRLKLSPRLIEDFQAASQGEVVMYCLPEGAVALYPENVYRQMRQEQLSGLNLPNVAQSVVLRRSLRRFGALSHPDRISAQGRLTIPESFREFAGIERGGEIVIVGVEIGAEIWNKERWQQEMDLINHHLDIKGDEEMNRDLHE